LRCTIEKLDGAVCLKVSGELDIANVAVFQTHLKEASLDDSVILDFRGLRYLDSSGIKALLSAQRNLARSGRRLVIAGPSEMVRRVFSVLDVERVIPMFATVEEALAYLR
jgi:anti-anti-sigma factor